MQEPEKLSGAISQSTFQSLYVGANKIKQTGKIDHRRLKAMYIILLAGRLGLRTGEIQHVREAWIDWKRGEIVIPRFDPCACRNCYIRAAQNHGISDEKLEKLIEETTDDSEAGADDEELREILNQEEMLGEYDADLPKIKILREAVGDFVEEYQDEIEEDLDSEVQEYDDPEEYMYNERWQPKYPRSARRIPFGYSRRLTAVIMKFFENCSTLQISQSTMNNLVQEAAEHVKGLDPEEVSVKDLRATAANNYASFLRHPKVLRDIMGWKRIETARHYLRNSGAFTTDILYEAFGKRELAPVRFPGQPDREYPILNNPIPFTGEDIDPILYARTDAITEMAGAPDFDPGEERIEEYRELVTELEASETSRDWYPGPETESDSENAITSPTPLIHPRAKNAPDEIDYDPTKHEFRIDTSYHAYVSESEDGRTNFYAGQLSDATDPPAPRTNGEIVEGGLTEPGDSEPKYESMDEYEKDLTEQAGLVDYRSSPIVGTLSASWQASGQIANKIQSRIAASSVGRASKAVPQRIRRLTVMVTSALGLLLVLGWILVLTGALNPESMSLQITAESVLFVLLVLILAPRVN